MTKKRIFDISYDISINQRVLNFSLKNQLEIRKKKQKEKNFIPKQWRIRGHDTSPLVTKPDEGVLLNFKPHEPNLVEINASNLIKKIFQIITPHFLRIDENFLEEHTINKHILAGKNPSLNFGRSNKI